MISHDSIAQFQRLAEYHSFNGSLVVPTTIRALLAEREALISLLSEVRDESADEFDASRLSYVTVQMTPSTWEKLKEFGR